MLTHHNNGFADKLTEVCLVPKNNSSIAEDDPDYDPDLFVLKICVSSQGHPDPDYDPKFNVFFRMCVSGQGKIQ